MRRLLAFRIVRYTLLGMILILVMMVSAVTSMRFAIHGRELLVPKFVGMKQADAQNVAEDNGLVLAMEDRFYSSTIPEGAVLSQAPAPGVRVRRGTHVRTAISLGPPKTEVPDLGGQSVRAAQINVQRRGLELGNVSAISVPAMTESQVLAQSPPPSIAASSPKVNLLVSSADASAYYLMPDFTGKQLSDIQKQIEEAGFELKVTTLNPAAPGSLSTILAKSPAAKKQVVVRQTPAAGHRIAAKSTITLEILVQ